MFLLFWILGMIFYPENRRIEIQFLDEIVLIFCENSPGDNYNRVNPSPGVPEVTLKRRNDTVLYLNLKLPYP
jgi:hypothetical protein